VGKGAEWWEAGTGGREWNVMYITVRVGTVLDAGLLRGDLFIVDQHAAGEGSGGGGGDWGGRREALGRSNCRVGRGRGGVRWLGG
jgi:hypothetical protein